MSPSNPYSWLYSQAMDPNMAINMMMSKYQEELLRQYRLGSAFAPNPFNPTTSQTALPVSKEQKLQKPPVPKPELPKTKEKKTEFRYSKEANKTYYTEPQKDFTNLNMFKDRPGISITPIQNAQPPTVPTSPKTLQQKLAERQKNPLAQKPPLKPSNPTDIMSQLQTLAQKHMPFRQSPTPTHSKTQNTLKNLQKSVPSSLTITKSQQSVPTLMTESSISISQVSPGNVNAMSFRKPTVPKPKQLPRKLSNEITLTPNFSKSFADPKLDFPPNVPMSLSVSKVENKSEAKAKTDDVEIITIE